MIAFIILFLIVAAVASFDLVPFLRDIFERRGIGSLRDEEWYNAACNTCKKWSQKGVPAVPTVAGKRFVIIDKIKGKHTEKSIGAWQNGSVLLALNEFDSDIACKFAEKLVMAEEKHSMFNTGRVDVAYLAYAIMQNDSFDNEVTKHIVDGIAEMLLDKFEKYGSIPYSDNSDIRFVDTIGLVCPFLIKYGLKYRNEKAVGAAISLIKEYSKYGIHENLRTPVHCYNAKTKAPLGLYSWGRGCGWWAVGLVESFMLLQSTDETDFVKEKIIVLKNLLSFAGTVSKYQSKNGAFDRNIFCHCGEDSSATAMLTFFLAYVGKLSKNKEIIDCANKGMEHIYSVTRQNGIVDYSQGDTMGIGFYSCESIVMPVAQGFAIRAYRLLK